MKNCNKHGDGILVVMVDGVITCPLCRTLKERDDARDKAITLDAQLTEAMKDIKRIAGERDSLAQEIASINDILVESGDVDKLGK